MKPILFNADMVRAILDERKTVTRRVVKRKAVESVLSSPARTENPDVPDAKFIWCLCNAPYGTGDILYVRETWASWSPTLGTIPKIFYRADGNAPQKIKWRPSIHMPKEAARIFLRVTDVRVERLQEITGGDLLKEGIDLFRSNFVRVAFNEFSALWDSTIKPADRTLYSWEADPWVWVIAFERISREEAAREGGTTDA